MFLVIALSSRNEVDAMQED